MDNTIYSVMIGLTVFTVSKADFEQLHNVTRDALAHVNIESEVEVESEDAGPTGEGS